MLEANNVTKCTTDSLTKFKSLWKFVALRTQDRNRDLIDLWFVSKLELLRVMLRKTGNTFFFCWENWGAKVYASNLRQ